MSFYGNILNRIDKAFSKIKVNGNDIEATHENDILSLNGKNGIELSNEDKEIIIDGSAFITQIIEDTNTKDNALKYDFYNNDKSILIGSINIPLDLILESAKLSEDGTKINLTFKTVEGKSQTVDIDVAKLYDADEIKYLNDWVSALSSSVGELNESVGKLNNKVDTLQVAEYNPKNKALEFK